MHKNSDTTFKQIGPKRFVYLSHEAVCYCIYCVHCMRPLYIQRDWYLLRWFVDVLRQITMVQNCLIKPGTISTRAQTARSSFIIPVNQQHYSIIFRAWIIYHMMTSSNGNIYTLLAICAGNSPVPSDFPTQRPVTRRYDFDLRPNKRLSKQSWGWWFETPSRPLWRHRNEAITKTHSCHSCNSICNRTT